eukprot:2931232-Rhodomonas_salina.2
MDELSAHLPPEEWTDDKELALYLAKHRTVISLMDDLPTDDIWWGVESLFHIELNGEHCLEVAYPEIDSCPRSTIPISGNHSIRQYLSGDPLSAQVHRLPTWISKEDCTEDQWQAAVFTRARDTYLSLLDAALNSDGRESESNPELVTEEPLSA